MKDWDCGVFRFDLMGATPIEVLRHLPLQRLSPAKLSGFDWRLEVAPFHVRWSKCNDLEGTPNDYATRSTRHRCKTAVSAYSNWPLPSGDNNRGLDRYLPRVDLLRWG